MVAVCGRRVKLTVEDAGYADGCSELLCKLRETIGPVEAGAGKNSHSARGDVNLHTVPVILQFVAPGRAGWQLTGRGKQLGWNEAGQVGDSTGTGIPVP